MAEKIDNSTPPTMTPKKDESPHRPMPCPVSQHQKQARRQEEGAGHGQTISRG
ncbi:hypothetical protein JCM18920_989 [Cutibacterium acnes JCM 18920]|nr:hypothetical protein JCM18920_989 [Cutibacterium acnes JCM 18920]